MLLFIVVLPGGDSFEKRTVVPQKIVCDAIRFLKNRRHPYFYNKAGLRIFKTTPEKTGFGKPEGFNNLVIGINPSGHGAPCPDLPIKKTALCLKDKT
jgi:hypothetical protein